MIDFNIIVQSPRMKTSKLDLSPVADALVESSSNRILRGYNILDQPSRPLSLAYAGRKAKAGAAPIRNWSNTKALMQSYGVKDNSGNSITIGWPKDQQQKVAWNEKYDHMAGLSPNDREAGRQAADNEVRNYLSDLW